MQTIKTIGVVGAGQMGRGIAQLGATHGYSVKLVDASLDRAEAGREHLARDLARLAADGLSRFP